MPRTETCALCNGKGTLEGLPGDPTCPECRGNGYVMTDEDVQKEINRLVALGKTENGDVAPLLEPIDLTDDTPAPGRMANQTWRILEEQRHAAEDTIRECETEIERWTKKLDDAARTKCMCDAGQRAQEGML